MERIILNFKNFLLLEQSKDANLYSYDKLFESGTGADYVMPDVKTWINLRLDGRISSDKKINYKDKLIWNSQKDKYKSKLIDDVVSIYGGSDLSKQDIWFEIMKYGAAIGAGIGILFFVNKGLKRFESYKNFIRAVKGMFKKNIDGIDQKDLVILKNEIFSDAQLSKSLASWANSRPVYRAEEELASRGIPDSNILVLEETIEEQISKMEKEMFGNNEYLTKSNDVILRFTDNELKKNAKVDALNNQDVYKCYSLTDDFIKKITKDDRGNYYYENVQVKLDKMGILYHPKILKASNGSTISNYSGFITFLKTIKDTKKMETDALEGLSNEGIEITGIGQREKNIKTILKTLGFASPFVGELVLVIANIDKIKAKIFPEYVSNMHGETFISVLKAKLENTDGFEKFKDDIVSNNREDTKDGDGNVTSVRYPEELPYKVSYHLAYLVGEYYGKVVPSVALVTIKNNPSIS